MGPKFYIEDVHDCDSQYSIDYIKFDELGKIDIVRETYGRNYLVERDIQLPIFETEEEYKKLLEDKQLEEKCTEEVLQVLYTKVEEKLKELKIPRGILVQDSYWSHKNLYVFFENGTDKELIEDKLSLLYDFLNFDLDKLVVEVAESLNCLDFISIYSKEFAWHFNYYWLASKEELENFESMSFMELNKHFNELNLKGSNFVRLIGE